MAAEGEAKGTENSVLSAWQKKSSDGDHLQQGMPFAVPAQGVGLH